MTGIFKTCNKCGYQWETREAFLSDNGVLLRNGIHIYEMEGKMLHTKAAVVDGHWLTIGSDNLDPISLFSCMEINVALRYPFCANRCVCCFKE